MEQLMKVCKLVQHRGHLNWENVNLTISGGRFFILIHSKFFGRKAVDCGVKVADVPMEDMVEENDSAFVTICFRVRSWMEDQLVA